MQIRAGLKNGKLPMVYKDIRIATILKEEDLLKQFTKVMEKRYLRIENWRDSEVWRKECEREPRAA